MRHLFLLSTTVILSISISASALAQAPSVPGRQLSPAILAELHHLENQFDLALSQDCTPDRCFSKGCSYVAHAVTDRPPTTSLPGLGQEKGPGSSPTQEYLTLARCGFAHEKSVRAKDVTALVKRLEQKLSKGWLVVQVQNEALLPISPRLREPKPEKADTPPPPPPEPEEEPIDLADEPVEWDFAVAARELWLSLLPHFSWMIALFLVTIAALIIIWALRRLGRESPEEQALLAQLAAGESETEEEPEQPAQLEEAPGEAVAELPEKSESTQSEEDKYVGSQLHLWSEKFTAVTDEDQVNGIQELLGEWLRAGEMALLAKAVLLFPESLPLAFPSDGELGTAKLVLSDYLKTVDPNDLPSDEDFFKQLNQHALSTSLATQADAELIRSLREEFGTGGLARLMDALPARHGALLFSLAPVDSQHEVARMLKPELTVDAAEQLLASNRMAKAETAYLFDVLGALRKDEAIPAPPAASDVADRGRVFDAGGAVSILLSHVTAEERAELFSAALSKSNGAFPQWYEEILFGEMLINLPAEMRTNIVLDVDINGLGAWLSLEQPAFRERFTGGLTPALQAALHGARPMGSRADKMTLAR
ncbi:hypothetical protein KAI87_02795, partial [Myxococcota bacterium]|nr:hypothetical protein [Myxococcota bacterium]